MDTGPEAEEGDRESGRTAAERKGRASQEAEGPRLLPSSWGLPTAGCAGRGSRIGHLSERTSQKEGLEAGL